MDIVNIGILSISDRASAGIYEDKSGAEIKKLMQSYIKNETIFHYKLIADEFELIKESLIFLSDEKKCDLILSTGGTGPAPRDVTPEATEAICEKILPGFAELMRQESLKFVPTAILSRQVAGKKKKPHHKFTRSAKGDKRMLRACISSSALLHRLNRRCLHTNKRYYKSF